MEVEEKTQEPEKEKASECKCAHYWAIHKKMWAKAMKHLEWLDHSVFQTITHDESHETKEFCIIQRYVNEQTQRRFEDETYPFNDKWSFRNEPQPFNAVMG